MRVCHYVQYNNCMNLCSISGGHQWTLYLLRSACSLSVLSTPFAVHTVTKSCFLNVRAGGNVYYQVLVNDSTDEAQAILASISHQSSAVLFPDIKFYAKWALLVTWNRVPFYHDSERVRQRANVAYEAPHSASCNVPVCMCASVNSWFVD